MTFLLPLLLALQFELVPIDEGRFEDLKQDVDSILIKVDATEDIVARMDERTQNNTRLIWGIITANGMMVGGGAYGFRRLKNGQK